MGGGSLSISLTIRELLLRQIYLNTYEHGFRMWPCWLLPKPMLILCSVQYRAFFLFSSSVSGVVVFCSCLYS